mmetsp:Transcript_20633/g.67546  ORF Transcript_20633/g.67546 Transcript_20633/m.67546 type:complete len:224 (-) Transcript_20633:310-981(-)
MSWPTIWRIRSQSTATPRRAGLTTGVSAASGHPAWRLRVLSLSRSRSATCVSPPPSGTRPQSVRFPTAPWSCSGRWARSATRTHGRGRATCTSFGVRTWRRGRAPVRAFTVAASAAGPRSRSAFSGAAHGRSRPSLRNGLDQEPTALNTGASFSCTRCSRTATTSPPRRLSASGVKTAHRWWRARTSSTQRGARAACRSSSPRPPPASRRRPTGRAELQPSSK